MATTKKDRHLLFHGELSDAPGRNESWDDYIEYRSGSRWELTTEGSDFSGMSLARTAKRLMSTKALVDWVLERDAELNEGPLDGDDQGDADGDDSPRRFGPYARRLREIAVLEIAGYCVSCLDGWLAGVRPPGKKQHAVHILQIKGVTRRGVWMRIFHTVFDVDTNLGPAFLYPPDADRVAKLILKTESSMSAGRMAKVPRALMPRIEGFKTALELLCSESAGGRWRPSGP